MTPIHADRVPTVDKHPIYTVPQNCYLLSLLPLILKGNLGIDPVTGDVVVLDDSLEFLHIDRFDIAD